MSRSTDEQIEELQKQIEQKRARIRQLKARENAKARRARTHRLIQVGAIVEQATGVAYDSEQARQALSDALVRTPLGAQIAAEATRRMRDGGAW